MLMTLFVKRSHIMSQFIQNIISKRHQSISNIPHIGDQVNVHVRVFESEKERIQIFRGTVLKISGKGTSRSFTVRKISDGIGVERTFPFSSPILSKVEILSRSKVRRAKLYYIRKLKGRASRLTSAFFDHSEEISEKKSEKEPEKNLRKNLRKKNL